MAGIADPTGFNFLTNLMNSVGGAATKGLAKKKPPGLKGNLEAEKAFANAPAQALPGGGTLPQGQQSQEAMVLAPSMNLPLYQQQQKYKEGLAGVEGGAANLGAQQQELGQNWRESLQSIIGPLLTQLGLSPSTSSGITGAGGLLLKILGG